jgi:hypothetical protein
MTTSDAVTILSLATPSEALAFRVINEEWISTLFAVTDEDRRVLNNPLTQIVARITSRSSMLSAPAAIPAMIDVNLPAGFSAADLTLVVLIATLPEISSDRPARSASAITGTKPANDTRFSSSNNGVARDHSCGSFTISAFW